MTFPGKGIEAASVHLRCLQPIIPRSCDALGYAPQCVSVSLTSVNPTKLLSIS